MAPRLLRKHRKAAFGAASSKPSMLEGLSALHGRTGLEIAPKLFCIRAINLLPGIALLLFQGQV